MSGGLFPKQFDNDYRGRRLALWLLAPIVFVKAAMGANSVLNTRFVIESADAIPLADFSAGAQEAIIFMYQAWGLCVFLLAMLGLVALVRYRSMTPLVFLMLAVENIARRAIYMVDPYSFAASPLTPSTGALINYALMVLLASGFLLSLWNRRDPRREAA